MHSRRTSMMTPFILAAVMGVAQPMGLDNPQQMVSRPPSLRGLFGNGKARNPVAERKNHVPKSRRVRYHEKFKGKQPMVLSKKEHSFQLAHRLPGGVLMQPWQVLACLSKYSAETPASFA